MLGEQHPDLTREPGAGHVTKLEQTCDELKVALDQGKIGDIVAKHEKLILHYYEDVQHQAKQSFNTARTAARIGFGVLIFTVVYALTFDALHRFGIITTASSLTIAGIGIVSGTLIEFIAAVAFWLYARGAKQFSAFHICLERTHRYLLAYKIAEQLGDRKDESLQELVSIMANAPMITRDDVDAVGSRPRTARSTQAKVISAEVKKQA